MALFSRRKKTGPAGEHVAGTPSDDAIADAASRPAGTAEPAGADEPAAAVGISVSTFRGVGAAAEPSAAAPEPPAPLAAPSRPAARTIPAEAPPPAETIAGLRDNVLLRQALDALTDPPTPAALLNVARQLLQGQLLLRVKGDARALLAEGRGLPLAVTRRGDKQHILAFSSGATLQASVQADGDADTSAVAQPVLTVLRHVLDGPYEGLVLDPSSGPARAVLPRPLIQRAVEQAHPSLALKTLLAAERTQEVSAAVAAALAEVPVWIAARRTEEGGPVGIAESRTADGDRYLEVYSHPLEVLALGRGDQALPVTAAQLGKALQADAGLTGLLIDPGGPWLRLSRDDLAPVLALA
jgi:hypothetical protein